MSAIQMPMTDDAGRSAGQTVSSHIPASASAAVPSGFLAEPHYLDRPDGRIAYDDQGQGPVVILVPGLGDIRAEYRMLAPLLVEAGYRVLAMDLRGHGQSSVGWPDHRSGALGSDIVALARHINAGPVTLAGTSMGAAAVAWAAAEAPELVNRLVLIGPFVRDVPPRSKIGDWLFKALIRAALAGPWAQKAWGMAYGSFYKNKPADFDAYRTALVANLGEPGRLDALKAMISANKADVAARLHEIRKPVLVVMGTADPDFPDPKAEAETVAGLLHGTVRMVEDTGHYPHVEKPDVVAALLTDFIGRPELL